MMQFGYPTARVGDTLIVGPTKCKVELMDSHGVVLVHIQTGDMRWMKRQAFDNFVLNAARNATGELEIVDLTSSEQLVIERIPLEMKSKATVDHGLAMVRWIGKLEEAGVYLPIELNELEIRMLAIRASLPKDIKMFSARTVLDAWQKKRRNGGDARTLFPSFHLRGGPGSVRTPAIAEDLLTQRLLQAKKETGPLRIKDIEDGHVLDVAIALRAPDAKPFEPLSKATVNRRFHATFSAYDVDSRNLGKVQTARKYRSAGARVNAETPLLVSQFDDVDTGVYLIDEARGLPWGRANLTSGVDEATQSFLGGELSHRPRDAWSAISAVTNAILTKDMSLPQYEECKQSLYAHGAIGTCILDNALYNHGSQFIEGCIADAGAIPGWSKPHTPTNKQYIERFNGEVKEDFTPYLLGNRGAKYDVEGLKTGVASAIFDLDGFRKKFFAWVTDQYANKPREDGLTTKQRWNQHFQGRSPLMPLDTPGFRLIGTLRGKLRFRDSDGLLRLGLRYQAPALSDLRKRLGSASQVEYRIHPYDLSRIYVFNPVLKIFIVAECIEPLDYIVGLTNYQQQLIMKRCRENRRTNPSLLDMVVAREQLKADVKELRASKKMIERRAGYRMAQDSNGANASTEYPTQDSGLAATASGEVKARKTIVVTDLERMISELDEVEIEQGDE